MYLNEDIISIADMQAKPNSRLDHADQLARYIWKHKPKYIVCIGDLFDFPSLSTYRSNLEKESGDRLIHDLSAGRRALQKIMAYVNERNSKSRRVPYKPILHFCAGNHEYRLNRFVDEHPYLQGLIDLEGTIQREGWLYHPFLKPVWINDVSFRHYIPHSHSKGALGGSIDNRLNKTPHSFCVGHEQRYLFGRRQNVLGEPHIGVVNGSFYFEDEAYRKFENTEVRGFTHWSGYTNRYGFQDYDVNFISLERLMTMVF